MDPYSIEVSPRSRKTIADVMTVQMAIKCGKSSKNHKLKTRNSDKEDKTRSQEKKALGKLIMKRGNHMRCLSQ